MKLKFLGERPATFQSAPAGVLITARPGETLEVDGGFEYLKDNPAFKVLDEPKPAKQDDDKGKGDEKKKGDEKDK